MKFRIADSGARGLGSDPCPDTYHHMASVRLMTEPTSWVVVRSRGANTQGASSGAWYAIST